MVKLERLRRVRWIFFDMGYTLVDEEPAVLDRAGQLADFLAGQDIRVSPSAIVEAIETAYAEYTRRPMTRALELLGLPGEAHDRALQHGAYQKHLERPFPDALDLVARLAPRYRIGIIANQTPGSRDRLTRYGMAPFISCCFASTEIGLSKPDLALFRMAQAEAGCGPEALAMVGDRIDNDIRPAKSLGWWTIRVLLGQARSQAPRDPGDEADFTVRNLAEVGELFG